MSESTLKYVYIHPYVVHIEISKKTYLGMDGVHVNNITLLQSMSQYICYCQTSLQSMFEYINNILVPDYNLNSPNLI